MASLTTTTTALLIATSLLTTIIGGGESASVRDSLQCACNTDHCREQNQTACEGAVMCYTQYLKRRDGSDPITRGCLKTRTSLLCENRRPAVANWPILVCCKNNMCNDQLPTQLAEIMGVHGSRANASSGPLGGSAAADNAGSASNKPPLPSAPTTSNDPNADGNNSEPNASRDDAIDDPRHDETEIDFNPSNASHDLNAAGNADLSGANSFVDGNNHNNKLYNNPRFLDTIRRTPNVNVNVLRPIGGADANGGGPTTGLTAFHVALLLTALACLFLLFLLGFAILRRQARLFNGAPYLVGQPVYSKEQQTTLTCHERNCTPTRLVLPGSHPRHSNHTAGLPTSTATAHLQQQQQQQHPAPVHSQTLVSLPSVLSHTQHNYQTQMQHQQQQHHHNHHQHQR